MFMVLVSCIFYLELVLANDDGFIDTEPEILTNLTISAFLDDYRNIRLNISWKSSHDQMDLMSIRFLDSDDCNPIDGIERLNVKQINSIIIPPLSLVHPADYLINGCEYNVILESDDLVPNLEQSLYYKIPDCVQDKCKCEKPKNSPYQIDDIFLLHDDIYFLKWKKMSNLNLTVVDITYLRENNSTSLTQVKEKNVTEYGANILLPDLKEDVVYRITVRFTYDNCYYVSSITMSVPTKRSTFTIILGVVLSTLSLLIVAVMIILCSPKLRVKLKKHICWNYEPEDIYSTTPLSFGALKEQVNTQYTPLEFLLNADKYDEYEFPRNKVIIENEIDKGAFGVVYCGEAFEIRNIPGYTKIAIKQLRVNASEEEKQDLLSEMKILKKVGEHKNIVRLLGCVTIDQPYMMLLELVPCGSLKRYLMKLREKWSKRKSRFFFANDEMDVYNPTDFKRQISDNLNYTKIIFDDSDDSYIQPDNLCLEENIYKSANNSSRKYLTPDIKRISECSVVPQSPISIASSGIVSCAETEMTNLSMSEPSSPTANELIDNIKTVLNNNELQQFSLQIAEGMKYLESIKVTHRDLAARNILMANDKVLKITDFGLSRVGTYVSSIGKKLPLRWMAIEAIEEKICNTKTDVWSFGVVLWEIGTLGAFPYHKTPNNQVLYDLKIGKRLERPKICTDDLYKLMLKCWNAIPEKRPTFYEIVKELEVTDKKVYVDFSNLSPTYVFPPFKEETECT